MPELNNGSPAQGTPPEQAPQTPVVDPAAADAGQSPQQAPLEDVYKGKTAQEIAQMHKSAETKLGEVSEELGGLRKRDQQVNVLLRAIYSNPELYNQVDSAVKKLTGTEVPSDGTTPTPPSTEGSPKQTAQTPQPSPFELDARRAMEADKMNEFERKFGIDQLPPTERKNMHTKIGIALANMIDPGGNKSYQEIVNGISISKLPMFLENAYFIANRDNLVPREKLDAIYQRNANNSAAIGGIPSSGTTPSEVSLSPEEKETARKMNIPEDKYLQRKKEIQEA